MQTINAQRFCVGVHIEDNETVETLADHGYNSNNLELVARRLENLAKELREREEEEVRRNLCAKE